MNLMRRLGVSYNSAWMLNQKLMQVMLERDASTMLTEHIEINEAYIGGERTGGKVGQGAEGKFLFVAAVQTDVDGRPQKMALRKLSGFTSEQINTCAKKKLKPSADIYSDASACFAAVMNNGCSHALNVSGRGKKSVQNPSFKWVNTALGNMMSSLTGTYRHNSSKHVVRYLTEFQHRFNRRNDLAGIFSRLGYISLHTPPMPYSLLKMAETSS